VLNNFETELTSLDGSQASVAKLNGTLQQMKQAAPAEIAPDVQELASVVGPVASGNTADLSQLQSPAFSTANTHLAAWATAHCGVSQ
jgi:hypothetical protein